IWTEELSRFLFIWMIMLGSMVGVREGTHFVVDVLPDLPPRADAALQVVSNLFVLAFALVFVWWGIEFVRFGWDQSSELAELPMVFIFVAWPVAGLPWVLFLGEALVASFRVLLGKSERGCPRRCLPARRRSSASAPSSPSSYCACRWRWPWA